MSKLTRFPLVLALTIQEFHIKGLIQHVRYYFRGLSVSRVTWRLIYFICIGNLFLLLLSSFLCYGYATICLSIHLWCTFWLFLIQDYYEQLWLGFIYTWTKNFQIYKLDLEKAEEPEIKLPTFIVSQRKQRNYRKTSMSASLTTLKPLTVWITSNCEKLLKSWEYHLTRLLRNLYAGQEATIRTRHGTTDWFKSYDKPR